MILGVYQKCHCERSEAISQVNPGDRHTLRARDDITNLSCAEFSRKIHSTFKTLSVDNKGMFSSFLSPKLPHLIAPYIDVTLRTPPTLPEVQLPEERHQLHLVDTDEWELKKAIAETGLQGGLKVLSRRWQNTVDALPFVERFKTRYPHRASLFDLYFGENSTNPDNRVMLSQLLDSGRIDFDFLEQILLESLLQGYAPKNMRNFLVNFDWLSQSISMTKLKDLFMSRPSAFWGCLIGLGDDENIKTLLEKYLCNSGAVNLRRILDDTKMKLSFDNYEVASLNASAGILRHLGLRPDQVVMKASDEIDIDLVRKKFPEYQSGVDQIYEGRVTITFHDGNRFDFFSNFISLSYQPFKFAVPNRVSDAEREVFRRRMALTEGRKIIVASSPDGDELSQILSAYCKLKVESTTEPPLLILGLRYPDENLAKSLQEKGLSFAIRGERDQKNQKKWTAAGESVAKFDIVILHTRGELMDLFAVADLAIVGENRNLMEPAAQGVPILYANGCWYCNDMAKALLDSSGAAHVYDPKVLAEQIRERLNEPDRYRDQGESAFAVLNEQLMPDAAALAALAIGAQVLRRASSQELS